MNKIFKVIYSKTRHCYVVVSELAKSHCKTTQSHTVRSKTALTAAVLLALGAFSFVGMPVVQAADGTASLRNNDFVGANDQYWYYDEDAKEWKTYQYKLTSAFNNRARGDLPNYQGGGAKLPGAISAGLYAQAGQQTVTIGDRNAGASSGSVFIGEHSGYDDGGKNSPTGASNNYVTSVGFQSDATGWGSIAIGSNAIAENSKMTSNSVTKVGNYNTTGTVRDDTYSIEAKPTIEGASVALGYNAHSKDGNIAIGSYSDATSSDATSTDKNDSYVSVGNANLKLKRRITNVADGTETTDVATVGQMNKAIESIGTTGWNLSTNGNSSSTTITSGKTVDFSPAVDGKNGTRDHKNVKISNDGSNVKISLNKDIVLGEATNGNGGSLNVYSDSTEASNLGNCVSIDGSTVSVYYGSEEGASGTKRGVVLGVGEDWNRNAQGYIAFNNIDPNGKIDSTYLHSATDAPDNLKGRLVYSNTMSGTEYIANLDDGITFTGDVQKDVPKDYTQTPTKLNTTLNITGGAATEKDLTEGNIGVVSTPAAESADGTTQASKLEIKLNKDLKGITSITSQTTDGTTTSGATITLGTNGTTISGGDVNVNTHKITGLKDGTATTDAATVGQMNTAIGNAKTKYYSVTNSLKLGDYRTNENNDGAADYALAGMAAGYETGTTGIASTVAGSYSGVIGSGLQGAAAVSVGTVNVNKNTDPNKKFSGVANSIVGQANMTTNSNAAIIYGAGNTVKNSYRDIDTKNASEIKAAAESGDVTKLGEALQKAVPTSGGQVMVMGGGNNVESAYMSQVVGVGNTVKGNQVKDDKKGWVTDTSPETAINNYDPKKSSQYNYVDGFNNEVINGKHDYVIGANNKLSGDSYDDDQANPIKRSNKSNIVIGDNHTLTRKQNTVIIGSSDTENTQTIARDAVIIGHNANATSGTGADNAVAIGLSATATGGNAVTIGVNTSAGENSITIGSESSAISGQNIAIGRYAKVDGYKVTKAVALGQKAEAYVTDGVAIGSGSIATVAGNSVEGYDPTTGQDSTDGTATWKATNAAVSIGTADGKVTRQINGVAAGTNDTDAVNVAQLKKLEGMKANVDASNVGSNIKVYKTGDDKTPVLDDEATKQNQTENENAWGAAIGTGKVAKDNGQLVTGKTVYDALHGGLDDVVFGHDGKDGKDGSIGLVGPKGQDGKDGKTTTIIKTETGAPGVNGEDGKDGITRIVYNDKDNPTDKHTVATLDDGMKYAGDTGDAANVALNHQLKLSGTTFGEDKVHKSYDEKDWTSDNIAVVSDKVDKDGNAVMNLKLSKDLKDLNSSTYTTTETTGEGDQKKTTTYTTIINGKGLTIQSGEQGSTTSTSGPSITIDGIDGGGKAITNISSGIEKDDKGNYTDKSKLSAANINDVQTIVNDAKKDLTDGKNGLNNKANVDASNIGENLKDADGRAASTDAVKTNKDAWASAIGTNEVKEGNKQLVTSDAVAKELANKADKSYVDQELGKKADKTYVDEKLNTKADKSEVYTKNETYSKSEVDNKVTNITKGLDDKANKDLGNITDAGKQVIKDLAKGAVKVIAGTNTTVAPGTDKDGATTYAVNVEGNGKVASGNTGLISGGTLYNEVHVTTDGSYIKSNNTVGQNLSALDSGLKTTSDLIHTNTKGDTIQIGGNSTATKIDVNGKDGKGRVITGVVSDANDPNSAANVGYVNGLTAANTQQIYRDMNNAYSRLDTNINRAAAGSNALAALHPLDFDPADKASFAVGYGHYRNANAAAVGAFYQPNANTMVNMGISLGNGDPGFNAGVSFKIGKGSAYNGVSKAEMAQTIHDQATEISAIKADDAAKDKRIDALEKENQEMKKQIQEILARLNG